MTAVGNLFASHLAPAAHILHVDRHGIQRDAGDVGVAIGVVVTARIRRVLFGRRSTPILASGARTLAVSSLVAWGGAIVAGRLMAYLK